MTISAIRYEVWIQSISSRLAERPAWIELIEATTIWMSSRAMNWPSAITKKIAIFFQAAIEAAGLASKSRSAVVALNSGPRPAPLAALHFMLASSAEGMLRSGE